MNRPAVDLTLADVEAAHARIPRDIEAFRAAVISWGMRHDVGDLIEEAVEVALAF